MLIFIYVLNLGWENNIQLFASLVLSMSFNIKALRGFSTNVANYQVIYSNNNNLVNHNNFFW